MCCTNLEQLKVAHYGMVVKKRNCPRRRRRRVLLCSESYLRSFRVTQPRGALEISERRCINYNGTIQDTRGLQKLCAITPRRFPNNGARGDLKDIDAIRSVCHRYCSGSVGSRDKTLLEMGDNLYHKKIVLFSYVNRDDLNVCLH
jgi:hypothetical protein